MDLDPRWQVQPQYSGGEGHACCQGLWLLLSESFLYIWLTYTSMVSVPPFCWCLRHRVLRPSLLWKSASGQRPVISHFHFSVKLGTICLLRQFLTRKKKKLTFLKWRFVRASKGDGGNLVLDRDSERQQGPSCLHPATPWRQQPCLTIQCATPLQRQQVNVL